MTCFERKKTLLLGHAMSPFPTFVVFGHRRAANRSHHSTLNSRYGNFLLLLLMLVLMKLRRTTSLYH